MTRSTDPGITYCSDGNPDTIWVSPFELVWHSKGGVNYEPSRRNIRPMAEVGRLQQCVDDLEESDGMIDSHLRLDPESVTGPPCPHRRLQDDPDTSEDP
ncbi:MAG: hypothetical protein VB878_04255 [Pirellulaceae bacterium]